jgi:hypothetical protein
MSERVSGRPKINTNYLTKMEDRQAAHVRAFGRIVEFGTLYPGDFTAGKTREFFAQIVAAEKKAQKAAADQASSGGLKKSGTLTKADFYDDLYEDLKAINLTAKSIADEVPGLEAKFRMPRSPSYTAVLIAARAFLQDATPLKAKFVEYEMPADFLTNLAADIEAFDAAEDDQDEGHTTRSGATKEIVEAVGEGSKALRKLDPLLRNKYRDEPVTLAEWFAASHVERPVRKKGPKAKAGE